jgi:hypothetical protein
LIGGRRLARVYGFALLAAVAGGSALLTALIDD